MTISVAEVRDRLVGPVAALVTPYDPEGSVHPKVVAEHTEYLLSLGVNAVLPGGVIGEYPLLSGEERQSILATTTQQARGRALVIANVSHDRVTDTSELVRHAENSGADAILATFPPFYALDADEQIAYLGWLHGQTSLPIMLYASNDAATEPPGMATLERIMDLPRVFALKESITSAFRARQITERFGDRLTVVPAAEDALPDIFQCGVVTYTSATTAFAPTATWKALRAAQQTDLATIPGLFEPVRRFRELFATRASAGLPVYIAWTKAACELVGLAVGPPRLPLHGIGTAGRAQLRTVLDRWFDL